jgi:hypothetical protein
MSVTIINSPDLIIKKNDVSEISANYNNAMVVNNININSNISSINEKMNLQGVYDNSESAITEIDETKGYRIKSNTSNIIDIQHDLGEWKSNLSNTETLTFNISERPTNHNISGNILYTKMDNNLYMLNSNGLEVLVCGSNSITEKWEFITNINSSVVNSGQMNFNNATQNNTTQIEINKIDIIGDNRQVLLDLVSIDTKIYIKNNDETNEKLFTVNSPPSQSSDRYIFTVTNSNSIGVDFINEEYVDITFIFSSNPFNQTVNKTDNVVFNELDLNGDLDMNNNDIINVNTISGIDPDQITTNQTDIINIEFKTTNIDSTTRAGTTNINDDVSISGTAVIGGTTKATTALLDLQSTELGFLPPRMTTAERDAISTPAQGLTIYNTTTETTDVYNDTTWVKGVRYVGTNNFIIGNDDTGGGITTSINNTIIGSESAKLMTDDSNTIIGYGNATSAINGLLNTILGDQIAPNAATLVSNTIIGHRVGINIDSSFSNTLIGSNAATQLTSGNFNTGVGDGSLGNTTTGSSNTGIGYLSATGSTNSNSTAIGNLAVCDASNQITLGNTIVSKIRHMGDGVADLGDATHQFKNLYLSDSLIASSSVIGGTSKATTALLDLQSTTLGFLPPRMTTSQRDLISTPSQGLNIYNTTTETTDVYNGTYWVKGVRRIGNTNLFLGNEDSGSGITTGVGNTIIGLGSANLINRTNNTIIGYDMFKNAGTAQQDNNVFIGSDCLNSLSSTSVAYSSIIIGSRVCNKSVACYENTVVGAEAMGNHTSGRYHTCIGYRAGRSITTGNNNTCIGYTADTGATNSNTTAIGYQAVCDNSNQITLGNIGVSKIRPLGDGIADLGDNTHQYKNLYLSDSLIASSSVIGGTTKADTALLDLQSTELGFLPPRMTTAERNAITNPAQGLTIYNITTETTDVYDTFWKQGVRYVNDTNIIIGNDGTGESLIYSITNMITPYTNGSNNNDNTIIGAGSAKNYRSDGNTIFGSKIAPTNFTYGRYNTFMGTQIAPVAQFLFGNTIIGALSGTLLNGAQENTIIGYNAGKKISSGDCNTGVGVNSLLNSIGSYNTCIGYNTDTGVSSNSTAIGHEAVCDVNNQITLGNTSINKIRPLGNGNANLGDSTHQFKNLYLSDSLIASSSVIGGTTKAGTALLDLQSTELGFLPPRMTTTQRDAISTPAQGLTIYNTTIETTDVYNGSFWVNNVRNIGSSNLILGDENVGSSITTGVRNTLIGGAIVPDLTGSNNTIMGFGNAPLITSSNTNTIYGYNNLGSATSLTNCVIMGTNSGNAITNGFNTVLVGNNCANALVSGSGNTCLGQSSGADITSTNNTCLGIASNVSAGVSNSTALGRSSTCDASNQITLGHTSVDKIRHMGNGVADLGDSTHQFKNLYLSDSLIASSSVIGGISKAGTAVLDLQSATQGFLPPRMTTTQRDAISTPAQGLTIYNTTTETTDVYNGTSWVKGVRNIGTTNIIIGNDDTGGGITNGTSNTIIGSDSGSSITTGSNNTCFGDNSGDTITTSEGNICIGINSGVGITAITSGNNNICIGTNSGSTYTNSISIGAHAVCNGSNQITLGGNGINQIRPSTDGLVNLGAPTNQFGHLCLSSSLILKESVKPNITSSWGRVYISNTSKCLVYMKNSTEYPIAGNEVRKVFKGSAGSNIVIYRDDYVTIYWDATNHQHKYEIKILPSGGGLDFAFTIYKNDTLLVSTINFSPTLNTEYWWTAGGVINSAFDFTSNGNNAHLYITAESDTSYPMYHIDTVVGGITTAFVSVINRY